jgi:hypothetical protein
MLVIVGASLLVVPIQLYWYWIVNIVPSLLVADSSELNVSIMKFVSLAGLSKLTPVIILAGLSLVAAFVLYFNSDRMISFGKAPFRDDAMFLGNVLVMLLFGSKSWPQNYVWFILPVALFLSGLLMEEVKIAYLMLVCFATFLLNSNSYPLFMYYLPVHLRMILPMGMVGSLMLAFSLIVLFMRPHAIFNRIVVRSGNRV